MRTEVGTTQALLAVTGRPEAEVPAAMMEDGARRWISVGMTAVRVGIGDLTTGESIRSRLNTRV